MTEDVAQDPMNDPAIQGEVVATGSSVQSHTPALGALLERAMVDAINACYANGVTDPESILAAKMAAIEKTKEDYINVVMAAQTAG